LFINRIYLHLLQFGGLFSLNDAREKSHKKAKKDKEKYLVKKSSYRKDVKQVGWLSDLA